MQHIVQWLLAAMISLVPLERPTFVLEAQETLGERQARYEQIAEAIAAVAFDPEEPPAFAGRRGRARTAALLLSVAYHESGFRRDVDLGLARSRLGKAGWNDYGRSWCMAQVHLGKRAYMGEDGIVVEDSASVTPEGWTGLELVQDRRKCFRAGLRAMRASLSTCRSLPPLHRLAAYASGSCSIGHRLSETRMRTANRLMEKFPRGM